MPRNITRDPDLQLFLDIMSPRNEPTKLSHSDLCELFITAKRSLQQHYDAYKTLFYDNQLYRSILARCGYRYRILDTLVAEYQSTDWPSLLDFTTTPFYQSHVIGKLPSSVRSQDMHVTQSTTTREIDDMKAQVAALQAQLNTSFEINESQFHIITPLVDQLKILCETKSNLQKDLDHVKLQNTQYRADLQKRLEEIQLLEELLCKEREHHQSLDALKKKLHLMTAQRDFAQATLNMVHARIPTAIFIYYALH